LLEENFSKQTESLLAMNNKLDSALLGASKPSASALEMRKAAAQSKKAMLAAELRDLKTEQDAIQAMLASVDDNVFTVSTEGSADFESAEITEPLSEAFWSDTRCEEVAVMLTKCGADQCFLGEQKRGGLPLGSLSIGKDLLVTCMFDTGFSPAGLITLLTLQNLEQQLGSPLEHHKFKEHKPISGVGKDAVMVIGTVTLPLSFDGRRLCCGVMVNGSTGCCDVLIGNFHMRHDWNFDMNRSSSLSRLHPIQMEFWSSLLTGGLRAPRTRLRRTSPTSPFYGVGNKPFAGQLGAGGPSFEATSKGIEECCLQSCLRR